MLSVPTTTVSVIRGTTTNQWGDEINTNAVHQAGIPASILEKSVMVTEADSSTPMTVRMITGRVSAGTDVTSGDRLQDEMAGVVYTIESITSNSNPLAAVDIRLDLKRVS